MRLQSDIRFKRKHLAASGKARRDINVMSTVNTGELSTGQVVKADWVSLVSWLYSKLTAKPKRRTRSGEHRLVKVCAGKVEA
jgi:hypothetical protein